MNFLEKMQPLIHSSLGSEIIFWGKAQLPLLEKLAWQWENGECYFVNCPFYKHVVRIVNVLGLIVYKKVDETDKKYRLVEVNRVFDNGNVQNRQLDVSLVSRAPAYLLEIPLMESMMLHRLHVNQDQFQLLSQEVKLKIIKKDSVSFPGIPTVYYLRIMEVFLHRDVDISPPEDCPKPTYEWVELK